MESFRSGDLDVLVATTVIEVGVDIPDASVMVIEDADRFGIAQLHQLRGRVGRSGEPAWCFLLSESDAPEACARLQAMESSNDGFVLADVDLELRGEGTILGARQKGRSDRGRSTRGARQSWPGCCPTGTWWSMPVRWPWATRRRRLGRGSRAAPLGCWWRSTCVCSCDEPTRPPAHFLWSRVDGAAAVTWGLPFSRSAQW